MTIKSNFGICFSIASAVFFGVSPLFAQLASALGMTPFSIVFFRYFFALILLFFIMVIFRIRFSITPKLALKIFITSIYSAATTILLYTAYAHIGIGTATTLHFLYPVFVVFFSSLWYKETISKSIYVSTAACAIGIAFFLDFDGNNHAFYGILLALTSSLTYALYILSIEKMELTLHHPLYVNFYISLFNTLLLTGSNFFFRKIIFPTDSKAYLYCLLTSLSTSVIASIFLQIGVKYAHAVLVSLLSLFEPFSSTLCGILFLGEPYSFMSIIGCIIILASLICLIKNSHRSNKT